MVTLILIVLCVALYGLTWYGLTRSGIAERLPQPIGGALGMSLFVGLFVVIILAGLVGNWLRRLLWRALPAREEAWRRLHPPRGDGMDTSHPGAGRSERLSERK